MKERKGKKGNWGNCGGENREKGAEPAKKKKGVPERRSGHQCMLDSAALSKAGTGIQGMDRSCEQNYERDVPAGLISRDGMNSDVASRVTCAAVLREGAGSAAPVAVPNTRLEWLQQLGTVKNLLKLGVKMAWGLKAGWLSLGNDRAGPPRPPRQRRGGLFPLPLVIPAGLSWADADNSDVCTLKLGTATWVALGCARKSALHGYPSEGWTRRPGKMHQAILKGLASKIHRFLIGDPGKVVLFDEVVRDLRIRKILILAKRFPPHMH